MVHKKCPQMGVLSITKFSIRLSPPLRPSHCELLHWHFLSARWPNRTSPTAMLFTNITHFHSLHQQKGGWNWGQGIIQLVTPSLIPGEKWFTASNSCTLWRGNLRHWLPNTFITQRLQVGVISGEAHDRPTEWVSSVGNHRTDPQMFKVQPTTTTSSETLHFKTPSLS